MVEATLPHERCDFYVYVIFRPDGVPIYVGRGRGGRWRQHIAKSHNRRLRRIIAKSEREGNDIPIVKVCDNLTFDESCRFEVSWIAALGREDLGKGYLVNLTDGGEGTLGWIPTVETRSKVNAKKKGVPLSAQHRERLSDAGRGRPKHPDHIEKMRARVTGEKNPMFGRRRARPLKEIERRPRGSKKNVPKTPEHAAKIGAALRGKKKSRAHCLALKAAWAKRKAASIPPQTSFDL